MTVQDDRFHGSRLPSLIVSVTRCKTDKAVAKPFIEASSAAHLFDGPVEALGEELAIVLALRTARLRHDSPPSYEVVPGINCSEPEPILARTRTV